MNISLIGMMGSGKTTVGKLLAEQLLNYKYIDTDSEIVNVENKSINEIFELYGEEYFRNAESKVLNYILKNDNQIISTGGGIIIKEENLSALKSKSVVFYLKASPENLYMRVKNDNERPLLKTEDVSERINLLLKKREEKYLKAHYVIDTDNNSPENTVTQIMEIINDNNRS